MSRFLRGAGLAVTLAVASASSSVRAGPPDPGVQTPGTRHPFTCCDRHSLTRVLKEYLDLHQSLHDAEEATHRPSGQCYALSGVLKNAVADSGLTPDERELARQMLADVDRVKDGRIGLVRAQFDTLSQSMVRLALAHQPGRYQVAEAACDSGGSWLQDGETLESPYGNDCGRWR